MRQAWPVTLAATAVLGMVSVAVSGSVLFVRQGRRAHLFCGHSRRHLPPWCLGLRVHPDGTPSAFAAARLDLARQLYRAAR